MLTPCTTNRALAQDWFHRFEGAGLDGVVAKHESTTYQPGKRAMLKVKHSRTADCAVAGFRWHKDGEGVRVGPLLLGLFDAAGRLQGDRFRHGTTFLRWRPDKRPEDCRYDQLEVTPPAELDAIFAAARR